ncbi:hypothetical protein CHC_T00010335001 [Chondrus crispus]|uniref:Uncharacterized protein n=1 Tax=Chondrus crispus TaxID=2769 RepID=R7QR92_CHOCR|nr:hypothetical protein CHC_T00010335001 [Chondrus crispus]CDF40283.1 hypothetical protein CHC_T00010335001 [Chondrus crispus]|eukprot:XP_005710577.1 hypothetical protein CHC_T00010335001 [Chondrus crispus]
MLVIETVYSLPTSRSSCNEIADTLSSPILGSVLSHNIVWGCYRDSRRVAISPDHVRLPQDVI